MKTTNFLLALALLFSTIAFSQVGIGTTTPDSSSILDVESTTKGFLPPRTTPGAITNPAEGLVIYNNSSQCLEVFNGTAWVSLCDGTLTTPCHGVTPPSGYGVVESSGKCWLDRNLGATRVAQSSTDAQAYGHLYQWGRGTDGHQIRTSGTTSTLSGSNTPGHGNFILASNSPYDWRSPQNNNLWQGVNGVNNPCPSGYRLPTETEFSAERLSWSTNNAAGAFASPLKLPVAGARSFSLGSLFDVGTYGFYWSSTVSGTSSRFLFFNSSSAYMAAYSRAYGFSVRCLKD